MQFLSMPIHQQRLIKVWLKNLQQLSRQLGLYY
jgi:hypothetical protein